MSGRDEVLNGIEYGSYRFGSLLNFYRCERGLSQAGLAHKMGKSPQYISALERQKGAQSPSMQALKELVNALAVDEETGETNFQAAADLTFSALDMMPLPMPANTSQELERQKKEPKGSTIWIISDVLLEAEERQFARDVLSNIIEREMKYTYFIQFGGGVGPRSQWERAYGWMENEAKNLEDGLTKLNKQVSAFELSACAFSSRLRITNPNGRNPEGRYNIGGRLKTNYMFLPAPIDLVVRIVSTLSELLITLEDEEEQSNGKQIIGQKETGFIRRLFP